MSTPARRAVGVRAIELNLHLVVGTGLPVSQGIGGKNPGLAVQGFSPAPAIGFLTSFSACAPCPLLEMHG